MYTDLERMLIDRLKSAVPPLYHEQRDQFARTLPLLALLSVVFVAVLGGWLGAIFSVVRALVVAPAIAGRLVATPFFWLELLPPILWAASIMPLRDRRLLGWRLFVVGMALALIASIVTLSIINLLFSAAILYFTLLCYDEFYK